MFGPEIIVGADACPSSTLRLIFSTICVLLCLLLIADSGLNFEVIVGQEAGLILGNSGLPKVVLHGVHPCSCKTIILCVEGGRGAKPKPKIKSVTCLASLSMHILGVLLGTLVLTTIKTFLDSL